MKSKRSVGLAVLFFGLYYPVLGVRGELTQSVSYSPSDISFSTVKGYDVVRLEGCELTEGDGEPQLPVRLVRLALPSGARVEEVKVVSAQVETLGGKYLVYPSQPPRPLSVSAQEIAFVEPKEPLYNSRNQYPGRLVELTGIGNLSGQAIAGLLVYPLQYLPRDRRLLFYRRIEFTVRYTQRAEYPSIVENRGEYSRRVHSRIAHNLVSNPQDLRSGFSFPPPDDYEYVVITNSALAPEFQRLADWKTKKGIPAKVVLVDSIYASYPGYDEAEKVRNFIIDAYSNWGTTWVLLGGDPAVVPDRVAYAMTCGAGQPDEDSIRCDLYYSDLDGSWDSDGDHVYGEVEDSVDMYPDIFVGRATITEPYFAQIWVDKVLIYERNPPLDYQLKLLFLGEILWQNPYTDGGAAKNFIDDQWVPPRFDPILKLYESLGNENRETVMAALNDGQSVVNHNGHAWVSVLGIGNDYLTSLDMLDSLYNSPKYSMLFSIGCWPGAFDYDWCIGKCFIISPQGGGVAFVGNSRYGWGSPGNPEYGYSDRFDQQLFRALFHDDISNIGAALADAKSYYVSRAGQENVYRWCEYELNLLGDPELPVWTDIPHPLVVEHPDTVPLSTAPFVATVRDELFPVEAALVCVTKDGEVYERGLTAPDGQISLTVTPSSSGSLLVTVTAPNFLPYEGSSHVLADGPWVGYFGHQWVDTVPLGNGDGVVNPGETITAPVALKNYGTQPSYGVAAALRSEDPFVTIIDGIEIYGDMAPGDTCTSPDGFDFSTAPGTENGHVIYFALEMTDSSDNSWSNVLTATVAAPNLTYEAYSVDDSWGNGNGVPEPGEHITLSVMLENDGLGVGRGVTGGLSTAEPHLAIIGGGVDFGDIQPGSTASDTFGVDILSSCPLPHFPSLHLESRTNEGHFFTDDFLITVGQTGFSDWMEGGPGAWTHGGVEDLWHLSSHRSHSASHSWYCGNEGSWVYNNLMDCWLLSPRFVLAPESKLSFWRWFDVAVYGITGFYVELIHGSGMDTLDFIGSGGALDSLYVGDDWHEESYDLSSYPVGDTVQVRFSFRSDDQPVAEGLYIDDFCCIGIGGVVGVEEEAGAQVLSPAGFALVQNQPNPFTHTTTISFHVAGCRLPVSLKIYDLSGRLVKTLLDNEPISDFEFPISVVWDGRDEAGQRVAAGVYFYRLGASGFVGTKKMVLVR